MILTLAACGPSTQPEGSASPEPSKFTEQASSTPSPTDSNPASGAEYSPPDAWEGEIACTEYDGVQLKEVLAGTAEDRDYVYVGQCGTTTEWTAVRTQVTVNGEVDPAFSQIFCGAQLSQETWTSGSDWFIPAGATVSIELETPEDIEWAWVAIVPKEHMPE
ncbi:hypothetical protein GCM10027417_27800 [Glutamicibacter endophyticus]